jgi:hypothetical protein
MKMKNTLLLILVIINATKLYSQITEKIIYVNYSYNEQDTTRTFSIGTGHEDISIETLLKVWGKPKSHFGGDIVWNKINIDGVGFELNVKIKDGILTMNKNNTATFKTFLIRKKKRKNNLKPNETRWLKVEILDKNGINIVNSKEIEIKINNILTAVLK